MDHPDFDELFALFPGYDKARAIIRIRITRIADSCGWGVPFYEFKSERDQLHRFLEAKSVEEWKDHRYTTNAQSIDGLPGLVKGEG